MLCTCLSSCFSALKTRLRRFSFILKEHLKGCFILLPEVMPVSLCIRKKTSLGSRYPRSLQFRSDFFVETPLYTPSIFGIRSMLLNGSCPVYRQKFPYLIQARIGNPFLNHPSRFGGGTECQKVGYFGQCPFQCSPQTFKF